MSELGLPEKECEPDDPMELYAHAVSGDAALMLDQLIESSRAWAGTPIASSRCFKIRFIKRCGLKLKFGLETIRERIAAVIDRHDAGERGTMMALVVIVLGLA
jgi:hypothetical protein